MNPEKLATANNNRHNKYYLENRLKNISKEINTLMYKTFNADPEISPHIASISEKIIAILTEELEQQINQLDREFDEM